jgi:hypothetical protein
LDWADILEGGVGSLLVDPGCLVGLPADQFLRLEPERNLLLGRLDGVRAVADVATNLNKISGLFYPFNLLLRVPIKQIIQK